ncbi:MAG: hypothetical protein E6I32_01725 [Chloroflexi bacterium]|nr:MAG: hypothetical protein E6I32_01725 [Chloroflexota bacterium]
MQKTRKAPFEGFDEHDQPTEPMSAIILSPRPPETPPPQIYPVLPPPPLRSRNGRPAGGAPTSGAGAPIQPVYARLLVGVFFVAVQLVLLARVILLLFGVPGNTLWIELVYAFSSVCAWPFQLLLEHVSWPVPIGAELINYLASLLGVLGYGLLSRILVRFLKALLHSR